MKVKSLYLAITMLALSLFPRKESFEKVEF